VEEANVQRLKKSLDYLQSKQREVERCYENDTRSLESMIKYLKKDMVEQFKLLNYDESLKLEITNTRGFINIVENIIKNNS